MNITDFQETWQIDVGGEIYEANFEIMTQWIFEGSLLPQDMVRRGNLRWIEARKVPALVQFFNAKEQGLPPPVTASTTNAQMPFEAPPSVTQNLTPQDFSAEHFGGNAYENSPPDFQPVVNPFETGPISENFNQPPDWQAQDSFSHEPPPPPPTFNPFSQPETTFNQFPDPGANFQSFPSQDFCSLHPDVPSAFLCETCANAFCKICPKSYGGTVKICPFCGAMCNPVGEVRQKEQEVYQYQAALSKGFGIEDFFSALAYPFKFKTSLIAGAIMFMLFTLGQSASSMGMSFFLVGAGIFCHMLSNMLTFGILANTVENFAQGRIGENFMPSFDDFSLWDDVVHPFFLSIAVYLVSFGLFIAIIIGGVWYTFSSITSQTNEVLIKKAERLGDAKRDGRVTENGEIVMENEDLTPAQQEALSEGDIEELQKLIQEQRKKDLESVVGKTPETKEKENRILMEHLWKLAGPFLIVVFLAFLWGIFYLPAACCVAGYTRSFVATLNPTIGLETIKLLGWDYVKLWLMGLVLVIASFIVGFVLAVVFFPFNLPSVGNLPANAVGALFMFYLSIVFSVILGFALYKNADKLNLFKG